MENEVKISIEESIVEQVEVWQQTDDKRRAAFLLMNETDGKGGHLTGIIIGKKNNVLDVLFHFFSEYEDGKELLTAINKRILLKTISE